MVALKSNRDVGKSDSVDPPAIRYAPHRRLSTKKAARQATRVAQQLKRGDKTDQQPNDGALFEALHACAYRAAGNSDSKPLPKAQRKKWFEKWQVIRSHLVERNVGLVYSMTSSFAPRDLGYDELRSEGMYALVRAVDGFNPWLGFQFSTYACNAITRSMIHLARTTNKYRLRFPIEHEAWQEPVARVDPEKELYAERIRRALDGEAAGLTPREALVVAWRFPMDGRLGLTLTEVGDAIGLSKERVRQIQVKALAKLRAVLEGDPVLQ